MTDVLIAEADTGSVAKRKPAGPDVNGVDAQLVAQLVEQARTAGLQLTGEGGLLQQLTKRVLESALEGEITDHLGYDKGDPAGKNGRNSRNGVRGKTVLTEVGPVELAVPRGITVIRPAYRTEPARPGRGLLRTVRQSIESVNQTFKGQLDLEQHGGRTITGVAVRVLQRVLALTAAIWHNWHTGQPIMRSLVAYDH